MKEKGLQKDGRIGGTKNLSLQLNRNCLFDVTMLELWNLLKAYNFQDKVQMILCDRFQSISAHSKLSNYSLVRSCACAPDMIYIQLTKARAGKRTLASNNILCLLIVANDHRSANKESGSHFCCTSPLCGSPILFP